MTDAPQTTASRRAISILAWMAQVGFVAIIGRSVWLWNAQVWSKACEGPMAYTPVWLICGKAEPEFYGFLAIQAVSTGLLAALVAAPFIFGGKKHNG